jgi:hypothetical protein
VRQALLAVLACVGMAHADAPREPGWEVRIPDRVEIAPSATGTLAIALAVDRGLTISKDASVIVDLDPDAGIAIRRRRLGRSDAVDPEADAPRFAVPVKADAPGDHVVRIRLRFWLCGGKVCKPIDVRRTATVAVVTPAP